jgi:prepilin-type N-terminal cleavage/methylation domain-containing protein
MRCAAENRAGTLLESSSVSRGYSMIELIAVIAIIGIILALGIPGYTSIQAVRLIDNEARTILMAFQQAKWQAAVTGLSHRLLFKSSDGAWSYRLERETASDTWTLVPGTTEKGVSSELGVTISLPASLTVVFGPNGFISNHDSSKCSIMLSSDKLQSLGQLSQRTIRLFSGGSTRMDRS